MKIEKLSDDAFRVTVSGNTVTKHETTVIDTVHQHLTGGRTTKEELLHFSFKLLLDRKSNTSIFSKFNITVISQYFPEHESELL